LSKTGPKGRVFVAPDNIENQTREGKGRRNSQESRGTKRKKPGDEKK